MSGLAKPMIHTTSALQNPSEMVNAELCKSVSKVTKNEVATINQQGRFLIVFDMSQTNPGTPSKVEWAYADEATRDTDYGKVVTAISAVLV